MLIVDDFDDALDIYQQYLTFKGYRVMTAKSGTEGIEIARAHHPAVIFMDLRMPTLTGIEAMRLLRSDAAFDAAPIVALTAHALYEDRVKRRMLSTRAECANQAAEVLRTVCSRLRSAR